MALKITYVICYFIFQLVLLIGAVLIPVYITPGYYWWTAYFIIGSLINAHYFGERMDKWSEDG